jgi:hypothetical protein
VATTTELQTTFRGGVSAILHSTAGYLTYGAIGLATYLYTSYCLREIARKRAAAHPWLAWIPFASLYLLCRIAGKGFAWTVFCLIPVIDVIPLVMLFVRLTGSLGRNRWYGLLLFVPMVNYVVMWDLAFGLRQSWEATA